jgi:hypothetical protein
MSVAVARVKPDSSHSPILAQVFAADGPAGMPGTVLWSRTAGSIGNQVGGLTPGILHWDSVWIHDGAEQPLAMTSSFYLGVSNPAAIKYEAFGHDNDTPNQGNSVFYDGCDSVWYSENDPVPNATSGTRMIRPIGQSLAVPTALVISTNGSNATLSWQGTGAPYYQVYSATTAGGPFITLVGSTSGTTITDVGAIGGNAIKFYVVVSSLTP